VGDGGDWSGMTMVGGNLLSITMEEPSEIIFDDNVQNSIEVHMEKNGKMNDACGKPNIYNNVPKLNPRV